MLEIKEEPLASKTTKNNTYGINDLTVEDAWELRED